MSLQAPVLFRQAVPTWYPLLARFLRISMVERIMAWRHVMAYRIVSVEWASKHPPSCRTVELSGQAKR